MVILLFRSVVQLLQDSFQFCRDGQTEMRGVLYQRHAFIGDVKEDHGGAKDAARADNLGVDDMPDTDEQEDEHLPADAFKAHLAGQILIRHSAHDARDVVDHNKGDQRIEQTVTAAEEPAQPAADGGEDKLNDIPEFFHDDSPP